MAIDYRLMCKSESMGYNMTMRLLIYFCSFFCVFHAFPYLSRLCFKSGSDINKSQLYVLSESVCGRKGGYFFDMLTFMCVCWCVPS